MALYFWAYSQMGEWLTAVLQNGGEIQQAFQTWLYPLWQMGLAAQGDWSALLIFSGISIACFALVFFTIFKTYLHLLTMNKGGRIIRSRYKGSKKQSVLIALLKKECIRILHSPMYLLNCAIGTIMMIGGGVYCVVTGSVFGLNADMVASLGDSLTDMSLLVAAIGCALASMNILTAPSVSLEGESIWILQTSPVSARQILESKLAFHLLLTLPGVLFCGIVFSVLLQTGAAAVLAILVACLFAAVSALFGLFAGLKFPNLHWTNEMAVIKQGVATMVGMFGSFGIILLLVGGYFLIGQYLPAVAYLAICAAVLGAVTAFLWNWLVKKGTEIFRYLS